MECPGESLLIRLWDTLTEKGIGGLLQPRQIRRVGMAQTDVECDRIRRIAQAEKEAADIRSGRVSTQALLSGSDFDPDKPALLSPGARIEPVFETPREITRRLELANALDRQVHVAKAVLHAEAALQDDSQPPPEERVDADWLFKWQQGAGEVSSEQLQGLWGRLLAGEIKAPGHYSLRCLDFLRTLSPREAQDIARLGPFVIGDGGKKRAIWREKSFGNIISGLDFGFLMRMQDLGILSGVDTLGLCWETKSRTPDSFFSYLTANEKIFRITGEGKERTLTIPCLFVTELGQQILSLGTFEPDLNYLNRLGQFIAGQSFTVEIGDCVERDGKRMFSNMEPVTVDPPKAA